MRITSIVFTSALVLTAAVGCGSTVTPCGTDSACIGGAAGTTSSSTTTAGTTTASTTGGMGGASSATSTAASSSASTGTGSGVICGGKKGATCTATEYCDFPADACSLADESGTCVARPVGCPDIYAPTCACDGKVYASPCDAQGAGVDINLNGTCPPPAGKFACGAMFCDPGVQYCERDMSDVGGVPSTYSCKALPPSCGDPSSCACLASVPCGAMCAPSVDGGGFVVTCPGG